MAIVKGDVGLPPLALARLFAWLGILAGLIGHVLETVLLEGDALEGVDSPYLWLVRVVYGAGVLGILAAHRFRTLEKVLLAATAALMAAFDFLPIATLISVLHFPAMMFFILALIFAVSSKSTPAS